MTRQSRYNYQDELQKNNLVFVYGTLKQNFGNSLLFDRYGGEFVREDCTSENFLLFSTGVPQALPEQVVRDELIGDSDELLDVNLFQPIKGEVWKINEPICLVALDQLESEGRWYMRNEHQLQSGDTAWMYTVPEINLIFYSKLASNNEGVWSWP